MRGKMVLENWEDAWLEDFVAHYRSSLCSLSCNVSTDTSKANSPKMYYLFHPLSVYSILSKGNPVAAYVFYLVFTLSFLHYLVLGGSSYGRCNQSISSSFGLLYLGCAFLPWLFHTSRFTRSVQLIFSILFHYHISVRSEYFLHTFQIFHVSVPIQILFIYSMEGLRRTMKHAHPPSWILLGHHRNGGQ
jgi:hypothetical protein